METLLPEEYHYTWNIYDIIKNNQINLSSGLGGNADQIGTKFFFLSLSRTGSFKLGYKKNQTSIGRIVFDGNKLNHDFKSIPVDYWGLKHTPRSYDSFEYEDRVVTDKPVINNITKYILRVEIITDAKPDGAFKSNDLKMFKNTLEICNERGVPCFIYGNEKDLRLKQNLLNSEILSGENTQDNYERKIFIDYRKILALLLYDEKYLDNYDLFAKDLSDYISANDLPEVDAYGTYDYIRSLSYGSGDFLSSLMADLHNYFKGGLGGRFRKDVEILVKDIKKAGVTNLKDLVKIKVQGIKPKTNLDFTKTYCLWSLDYNHDTGKYDTYVPIDSDKQLKGVHGLYFNVRRYGGYLLEDDFNVIWDLENKGGTVGQLMNYLMNKYTVKKASEIIYGSGFDSYEKLHKFKLDKIK